MTSPKSPTPTTPAPAPVADTPPASATPPTETPANEPSWLTRLRTMSHIRVDDTAGHGIGQVGGLPPKKR